MPRPTPSNSSVSSTVKENKPAWYGGSSPGRPNSVSRTGKGKPLGEIKLANRVSNVDGPTKSEKGHSRKKSLTPQDAISLTGRLKVKGPQAAGVVKNQSPAVTTRPTAKAPTVNETPPPCRPPKKSLPALVTPTNKVRRPDRPVVTPSSRARDKSHGTERTPVGKVKERPHSTHEVPKSGSKDRAQPFSAWAQSGARGRKTSSTPGRAPAKPLFLSPQMAKKTVKKEPLRMSLENHGIWIGSVPRKRAVEKRGADSEMPPAQPANSPEIPKRGSREASGEGIRGYFGAGPMVAPEGMGFVRDRRKCKPRGTLMVGDEGLSMDSDSSGVVESSIQMPLPSVASVEWMINNDMNGSLNELQSGSSKKASSSSLSELKNRENEVRDSCRKDRSSQEISGEAFLQQLRQSRNGDMYYQHARRSQTFLQHLKQTQVSRDSFTLSRQPQHNGDGLPRQSVRPEHSSVNDLEYEDITIDWRQGLPSESMEMKGSRSSPDVGKNDEFSSSLSFTSSWAPLGEDSKGFSGHAKTWYTPESSWYGFSPITPEFHRVSQLPEGGSKAIDALVAGSVRRRIIADQNSVEVETSSLSLTLSGQTTLTRDDSVSSFSAHSSQDTSSSFHFSTRKSYATSSSIDIDPIPVDTVICQTSLPIDQPLFSEDLICQTASPVNEFFYGDFVLDANRDDTLDGELESDYEVECASPIMGDYFTPQKQSSASPRFVKVATEMINCNEADVGAKGERAQRISRTLGELIRHSIDF